MGAYLAGNKRIVIIVKMPFRDQEAVENPDINMLVFKIRPVFYMRLQAPYNAEIRDGVLSVNIDIAVMKNEIFHFQ